VPDFFSLHISIGDDCGGGDHVKTYFVQRGDSLWLISQRYGISLDSLIAANPKITNPDVIEVGMLINIPQNNNVGMGTITTPDHSYTQHTHQPSQHCSTSYTVQSGDTMWQIAKKNGVTLAALINANPHIQNPNSIQVGQQICMPNANVPNANMSNDFMPYHKTQKGHKPTVPPTLPLVPTMEPLPSIPPIHPNPTEEPCPPIPTSHPTHPVHPSHPVQPTHPVYPTHPVHPTYPMPTIKPTICPIPTKPPVCPMPKPEIQCQFPREITVRHMHHICGCCSPYKPRVY
jgi:morphogenetic protein associated with SpoVID